MSVVYITKPGVKVHLEKNHLLVKGENYLQNIYTFNLDRLVLVGKVEITHAALVHLFRNGVSVVFLSRGGQFLGSLSGPDNKNTVLRLTQYRCFEDKDFRLQMAKSIVQGKIINLRTLVMRMARTKKSAVADQVADRLNKVLTLVEQAKDLESLRGFEGQASREYFRAYREGFSKALKFSKRVRRPPTDPVNACLSFGYMVLYSLVLGAVQSKGLDAGLGNLHAISYGRNSLALDLMEEFRPIVVDMTVLALFNLKILARDNFIFEEIKEVEEKGEEFVKQVDPLNSEIFLPKEHELEESIVEEPNKVTKVLLNREGKKKFIKHLEKRLSKSIFYPLKEKQCFLRDIVHYQVEHYISCLKGESKDYIPFVIR
ncbi:MAG: CRISPR-associated endonuclease Cas1 [Desulfonauticus sp. 38_4375]|nr:MAG: CRISPR-associated endonuclease Cas1 [Desulfonauticus sp. 38_4375]